MKVLITGATSGIGKQIALDYRADGHQVWAVGRNKQALEELETSGILTGQVDLADRDATLAWFSRLDVIDCAILSAGNCEYIDMPDFDSALFARVMRVNVESMAHSIEGLLPPLRRSSDPHLVGIGSSAAYVPLPRAEAYGSSKAAIAYLMDTLRITLRPENIAVSLVSPGFVKTPLTDRNDFPMPSLLTVEQASTAIREGIRKKQADIHFPKKFTYILKAASFLPRRLWLRIAARMTKK